MTRTEITVRPLAMIACGDRNWTNKDLIHETIIDYDPDVVIEGQARGADKLSALVVEEINSLCEYDTIKHIPMRAQWEKQGRAAGPIRNREMLNELLRWQELGYEICVIAFHDDIENSKGTKNMLKIAEDAGVVTEIVTS